MDPDVAAPERIGGVIAPLLFGALTYATIAQGGFSWNQGWALVAALVVCAVVAPAVALRGMRPAFAAFAILAAPLLASAARNGWPVEARPVLATLALAVGAAVAGRALMVLGDRIALLAALTTLGAGVGLAGIAGLALHHEPLALRAQGIWRASSTLTYANSTAALLTMTLFAAIALLALRPSAIARLALTLTLAGLIATLSRGGALGAAAGLAVVLMCGARASLRACGRATAAALVLAGSLVPSIASDDGRPWFALAGLVVSVAIALTPPLDLPRRWRIALIAAAAIATLGVGALASQHGGRLIASRIGPGSEDRLRTWGNVWQAALDQPLLGTGPGTFRIVEVDGGEAILTRYAHNEYLQAFSETGLLGLAAIAIAVALLGRWLWLARPRTHGTDRMLWAVAAASCTAFAVHSGFDFIWRMPLLVAVAFLWLGIGTAPSRRTST